MSSTLKYPKPYKNCSTIPIQESYSNTSTIPIQEQHTTIDSVYPKLEPPSLQTSIKKIQIYQRNKLQITHLQTNPNPNPNSTFGY